MVPNQQLAEISPEPANAPESAPHTADNVVPFPGASSSLWNAEPARQLTDEERATFKPKPESWTAIVEWHGPFKSDGDGREANYQARCRASDHAEKMQENGYISYGLYLAIGHLKKSHASWIGPKILYIGSSGDVTDRIDKRDHHALSQIKGKVEYWVGFIIAPHIAQDKDSAIFKGVNGEWELTEHPLIYACNPLLNQKLLSRPQFDFHITNRVQSGLSTREGRLFRRLIPYVCEMWYRGEIKFGEADLRSQWTTLRGKATCELQVSPAPEKRKRPAGNYWKAWPAERFFHAVAPIFGKPTASTSESRASHLRAFALGLVLAATAAWFLWPTLTEPTDDTARKALEEMNRLSNGLIAAARQVEADYFKRTDFEAAKQSGDKIKAATSTLNKLVQRANTPEGTEALSGRTIGAVFADYTRLLHVPAATPPPEPVADSADLKREISDLQRRLGLMNRYFTLGDGYLCMRSVKYATEVVCMVTTNGDERVVPVGKPTWDVRDRIEPYMAQPGAQ